MTSQHQISPLKLTSQMVACPNLITQVGIEPTTLGLAPSSEPIYDPTSIGLEPSSKPIYEPTLTGSMPGPDLKKNKIKNSNRVGNPQGVKTHNHVNQIKYITPRTRRVLLSPAGTGLVNKSDTLESVGSYPVSHSLVATPSLTAW